jgi:hypothetical protein
MNQETSQPRLDAIVITFDEAILGHDHVAAKVNGGEIGFVAHNTDHVCVERCAVCHRENYAGSVMLGRCCWCGWNANAK